ncbi:MAG: signal peptide peptidase SppA [Oscillospiraceae bacterium]
MKTKQLVGIIAAAAIFLVVGISGVVSANSLRSNITSISNITEKVDAEPANSIARIDIVGTIADTSGETTLGTTATYNHQHIMKLIEDMKNSSSNRGIMLFVNSGGGAVYQSDEVYVALMDYKAVTGRPVFAYSADIMASGAYYISCAADKIAANRNSEVGSIGVYISTVNVKGLYDKLGIRPEYIKSGANKAMGNGYDELTDEQRGIYQGIVDDYYNQFLGIVCESRKFTREQALPLCDGRIYLASQCVDNGLIDEIVPTYETFEDELLDATGADNVYERTSLTKNWFSSLFGSAKALVPISETQRALDYIESVESGVPMYYAG